MNAPYIDGRGLSTPAKSNAVPIAIVAGTAALLTVFNAPTANDVPVVAAVVAIYSPACSVSSNNSADSSYAYYIAGCTTSSSTTVNPLYI